MPESKQELIPLVPMLEEVEGFKWAEKVSFVAFRLSQMPLRDPPPIKHFFTKGFYIREMLIPKGALVVGRPHRKGHVCQLISGRVKVFTEEGVWEVGPGASFDSRPGSILVAMALEETRVHSVHKDSGNHNIDTLEDEHFLPAEQVISEGYRIDLLLKERKRREA